MTVKIKKRRGALTDAIFLITGHCHRSLSPGKHVELLFFGDSFFFFNAGNNNYINTTTNNQANFLPYAEFAKLPLIPTFLPSTNHEFTYGVNLFESGRADALTETYQGLESKSFQDSGGAIEAEPSSQNTVANAVYLFNIGTNDDFTTSTTNSSVLLSDYPMTICGNGDRLPNDCDQRGNWQSP
ncbi:hypothetical protein CUMW_201270 [Citrus unshiu]|uniref:Uncharacterized protein n=1 Tax=Citrus unshiu TaxID=55188 RepID=A0A2H5Q6T9_CITUN|nr:hypothetical protein CUMW_201270 [Citrus unshiu]